MRWASGESIGLCDDSGRHQVPVLPCHWNRYGVLAHLATLGVDVVITQQELNTIGLVAPRRGR